MVHLLLIPGSIPVLGLAHRNGGPVARTNLFEVIFFRVGHLSFSCEELRK